MIQDIAAALIAFVAVVWLIKVWRAAKKPTPVERLSRLANDELADFEWEPVSKVSGIEVSESTMKQFNQLKEKNETDNNI